MSRSNNFWLWFLSGCLVVSIVAMIWLLTNQGSVLRATPALHIIKRRPDLPADLNRAFTSIRNVPPVGGLMLHMMYIDDLHAFRLGNKQFKYSNFADCASQTRHTCGAYTYIRRDLPAMSYLHPSLNCPYVGILIDPVRAWQLITTLAVVDADTNLRNCLGNESDESVIFRHHGDKSKKDCMETIIRANGFNPKNDYVVYMIRGDQGGSCPKECKDKQCAYVNSGGGIHAWDLMYNTTCPDKELSSCFKLTEHLRSEVPKDVLKQNPIGPYLQQTVRSKCPYATKPYLCVPQDGPVKKRIEKPTYIATYIGTDGNRWDEQIMGVSYDTGNVAIRQCKFEKKDWGMWVNAMHQFYDRMMSIVNDKNEMPDQFNYMLGHPAYNNYLENEINVYINPNPMVAEKQNQIFLDSIVGVFYIPTTCEQQMSPLQGVPATYADMTFANSEQRCDSFFTMDGGPIGEKRRQYEKKKINEAKTAVIEFVKWFNQKFNRDIQAYRADLDSSAFVYKKHWEEAARGEVDFNKIFQPI